jgi:hypothetical protein
MRAPASLIQRDADPRRDWKSINRNAVAIGDAIREVRGMREKFKSTGRTPFVLDRLPFEVYQTPNVLRAKEDRAEDAWLKFKVRHGYVNGIKCDGCDDADGEGTTPVEIVVNAGALKHYVWVTVTLNTNGNVESAEIKSGEFAGGGLIKSDGQPADWVNFPQRSTDATKVFWLLAKIDTQTYVARKRALVRQFQRDDIHIEGTGGGIDQWSP